VGESNTYDLTALKIELEKRMRNFELQMV